MTNKTLINILPSIDKTEKYMIIGYRFREKYPEETLKFIIRVVLNLKKTSQSSKNPNQFKSDSVRKTNQ